MRFRHILMFFTVAVFLSCEKETPVRFVADLYTEFNIPSGLNTVETHYFLLRDIPVFYSQNAFIHNVDTASIQNVIASRGLLRDKFLDLNLDFISRISVYAISRKNPTLKREMFYLDQVPLSVGKELRMLSSTTQLKEILKEETIDIEIRMNVRQFVPGPLRARLEFGYAAF